jgi:outer membrane protein assembly factor BamB
MKRLISIVILLASLPFISYIFFRCTTTPGTGSKSVQISNNQQISEWREENRTGVSVETGLLKSWPANGPELMWTNQDLPMGYSSVSIGNNTIYVTGNDKGNDVLVAIDADGNTKWKTEYGRAWTGASPESRCTPTVEGDKVYVSSGNGDLACVDGNTGSIIWSLKASETFKGTYGEWGIAESLIIDGDKLYFTPGGPETTTIAVNKNNGELIWKSGSINDGPAYVSPILIDYAGKKLIINVSLRHVFAVDASNGTIMWKIKHTDSLDTKKSTVVWPDAPLIKCVTPLYHDGKIYVTGGYDHGGLMLKLNDSGNNVSVAWTDTVLDVHHGGVVLIDGYIYGANWLNNSNGNWCCIDWNTGKKMWEEHWNCKGSIISAEGLLYIYDEKSGYIGLVRPNPEKFDLISSFKVPQGSGPHWAHLVINNGNLYIRHGKALMVYDIKDKSS